MSQAVGSVAADLELIRERCEAIDAALIRLLAVYQDFGLSPLRVHRQRGAVIL